MGIKLHTTPFVTIPLFNAAHLSGVSFSGGIIVEDRSATSAAGVSGSASSSYSDTDARFRKGELFAFHSTPLTIGDVHRISLRNDEGVRASVGAGGELIESGGSSGHRISVLDGGGGRRGSRGGFLDESSRRRERRSRGGSEERREERPEKVYRPEDIPGLIEGLRHEDWRSQRTFVRALGRMGEPALNPLIEALKDPRWRVREGAARVLAHMYEIPAIERAVDPLIALLDDEKNEVRKEAAQTLAPIGGARAVPHLIDMLEDPDEEVRPYAVFTLGIIGDARARDPLLAMLKGAEHDYYAFIHVVGALGRIGGDGVVEALIAAIDYEDTAFCRHIELALNELGHEMPAPAMPEVTPTSEEERVTPAPPIVEAQGFDEIMNRLPWFTVDWETPRGRADILRVMVRARSKRKGKWLGAIYEDLRRHPDFEEKLTRLYPLVQQDMTDSQTPYDPHFGMVPDGYVIPTSFEPVLDALIAADRRLNTPMMATAGDAEVEAMDHSTMHYMYDGAIGHREEEVIRDDSSGFHDEVFAHAIELKKEIGGYNVSPGDYWIQGNNGTGETRASPQGRIYFAVEHGRAKDFWTELARLACTDYGHIPLKWKMAGDVERYASGDTAVLYFEAKDSEDVYELITALHRRHANFLRDNTPILAAKIRSGDTYMKGISFAQSPASRNSFNEDVADLATAARRGALLHEHMGPSIDSIETRRGVGDTPARTIHLIKRAISYAWEKAGISPDHPAFIGEDGMQAFSFIYQHSDQSPE